MSEPSPPLAVTDPAALGELVRHERQTQGILQDDLALAAGTGRRFIVELERGKPTVRLAEVLAVLGALGLSLQIAPSPSVHADA